MKYFISMPMNGKREDEILFERERIINYISNMDANAEIIDSYFRGEDEDFVSSPVYLLSKAIEAMSSADVVVFANGWKKARGCKIEHSVAKGYGFTIVELAEMEDDEE